MVSPGRPTPFPSVRDPPELRQGMAYCLTNNIWGTNYAMVGKGELREGKPHACLKTGLAGCSGAHLPRTGRGLRQRMCT